MAITPQKLKHRGTQMRNNKNQIITCPYTDLIFVVSHLRSPVLELLGGDGHRPFLYSLLCSLFFLFQTKKKREQSNEYKKGRWPSPPKSSSTGERR
jgi:hypothetical protein